MVVQRTPLSCNFVRVWQDGIELTVRDLQDIAAQFEAVLEPSVYSRVALVTNRVDYVVAALAACQARDVELMLVRERFPDDSSMWTQWRVSGIIDETLRHTSLAVHSARVDGFRILLTTSGTTGAPKVAKHTVERLLGRIRAPKGGAGGVRWLLTYHPASFAGLQVILTAMIVGGELICTQRIAVPDLSEAALARWPTHISGTPTFWRGFLLALGQRTREIPLVQITLGGEAVDQTTLDRLRVAFPGAGITHIYASTEAGALFAVRDGRAGFPAAWLGQEIEGIGLRLRNGLLEVRSPRAMEGYLPGAVASPFSEDGWLRTGDAVEVVGDRAIFRGRGNATINVGGAKVSPEEVEAVLLEVPVVADARVFAMKNPITGELVAAEVVLLQGIEPEPARHQILAHARTRLAEYKVPRIIRYANHIAASAVGKKQRV